MGDILASTDFDLVRGLAQVTSAEISDATLSSFLYLDYIEALVKQGITDYAAIILAASDNAVLLKSGTAYLLAARIVSAMRASSTSGVGFQVGGYTEQSKTIDYPALIADLIMQAKIALAAITTRVWTRPTIALMSGPTSSGANVPSDAEVWYDRLLPRVLDWYEEGGEDDTEV